MRNRLKQGNFLGCICISILLAGCMSMPKPPDKSIEDANSLQKQMALQLTSKDMNGAMTSLENYFILNLNCPSINLSLMNTPLRLEMSA